MSTLLATAFIMFALCMAAPVSARVIGLPSDELFEPLLADPKEPRFVVSFLSTESSVHDTTVAAVAYGEHYGFARWPGDSENEGWQLSFSGGVFAQFDMNAPSMDLINADYTIGFPISYRQGDFSLRLRWYHQSSHLGDEYLIRVQPNALI